MVTNEERVRKYAEATCPAGLHPMAECNSVTADHLRSEIEGLRAEVAQWRAFNIDEGAQRARAEAAEAKVAQHETTIRALTTRINVAEPKLDAWRCWGREHGYGLGPEAALDGE